MVRGKIEAYGLDSRPWIEAVTLSEMESICMAGHITSLRELCLFFLSKYQTVFEFDGKFHLDGHDR